MPRKVLLAGLAFLLAVAAGLWWLYASRDALLKRALERFGPEITGVSVSVSRVRLDPAGGKGSIGGLEVGNPAGYKAPTSIALGEIRLAIDYSTITSDVVHVKELLIDAPVVTYERGPGGDNLSVIQKTIGARVGGGAKKSGDAGKKFIIDSLRIQNAKLRYSDTVTLPMPDLHLRDVGKQSRGASADEVVNTVWDALAGSATNVASRAGSAVKEGIKSLLK